MPRVRGARGARMAPMMSGKTGFDWTEVSVPALEQASFALDDRIDLRPASNLPLGTEETARKTLERRISAIAA